MTILDDLGQPLLEGAESFELVLRMPVNAALGSQDKMVVVINDSQSDCKNFNSNTLNCKLKKFFCFHNGLVIEKL